MKLIRALGGLVSYMNIFAGIVGGLWLIILGKWQLPVVGLILALIAVNALFPILMLPGYALGRVSLKLLNARHLISYWIAQVISWLFNLAWITAFVYVVFHLVVNNGGTAPLLPLLLLAYSLVAGPLGELTINESDDDGPTKMIIFAADLGLIFMSIVVLISGSLATGFLAFIPFALFGMAWGLMGGYAAMVEEKGIIKVREPLGEESLEPQGDRMPEHISKTELAKYVDHFYGKAVKLVREKKFASAGQLQRQFQVSYQVSAALLDAMEDENVIGPADGARPREVL